MRVLHLIPSVSPLRGGPSQAVVAMVKAERALGCDARIVTTNDHGPGLLPELPLSDWGEWQGVPLRAFRRWSPPVRPLREFQVAPAMAPWLWQELPRWDLLHVHALFSWSTSTGMALARRRRVPYLLRTIGQLNTWSLRQSPRRKRLLLRLVDRSNLQGAAALHFTSAAEQEEAAALGLATPGFVLPLGVDLPAADALPAQRPPGGTRFVFLSRLHPKKQLPLLFEALAAVQRRRPAADWSLAVAGDGDPAYLQQLQQRASELGLDQRIHWLGFVAGAAKLQLLATADWFVLPSASENFGIAALEALAAGTPVLLSPEVALAAAVAEADAGRLCPGRLEPLTEALLACLTPPDPQQRAAARRLAQERFGWEPIARSLLDRYRTYAPPDPEAQPA
jgi:glycosyltransferase involved in cell wall biosynthesis